MEAANLVKVSDSASKGASYLPSENIAGSSPAPSPAQNSGKKLDNGVFTATSSVNDASSSRYADNDGND